MKKWRGNIGARPPRMLDKNTNYLFWLASLLRQKHNSCQSFWRSEHYEYVAQCYLSLLRTASIFLIQIEIPYMVQIHLLQGFPLQQNDAMVKYGVPRCCS